MIYHLLILVAKILIYFKFSSFLVTFANYFRGVSIRAPYYTSLIVKKLKRRGGKPKNTGKMRIFAPQTEKNVPSGAQNKTLKRENQTSDERP